MTCNHEGMRCTDNVFICPKCGCTWPVGDELNNNPPAAEKPAEAPKRAIKRKARKEAE